MATDFIPTKTTIITWQLPDQVGRFLTNDVDPGIMGDVRNYKVGEMTALGQTDGIDVKITDHVFKRHWIDQNAAQEYADFVTILAARFSTTVMSIEIVDYQP
jgi:hypothetical protein